MQEYRSGHNEAVLKTVCPKGTGVRIPLPAPIKMVYSLRVDLFLLPQSEGTKPRSRSETGASHTAGTEQTSRHRVFAVSASRGDGFTFERMPSESLLTSGGAKNLRQRRIPLLNNLNHISLTILRRYSIIYPNTNRDTDYLKRRKI